MTAIGEFWRRGEIVWVSLDPAAGREQHKIGQEQNKTRPAVIVSNDSANRAAALADGTITVVPLTSNIRRILPFHALVEFEVDGEPRVSKAQAERVRAISVRRVVRREDFLRAEAMAAVEGALRTHLGL